MTRTEERNLAKIAERLRKEYNGEGVKAELADLSTLLGMVVEDDKREHTIAKLAAEKRSLQSRLTKAEAEVSRLRAENEALGGSQR